MTTVMPELHAITHDAFLADVRSVADAVASDGWRPDFIMGIGRGGLVPAVYLSHRLDRPMLSINHSSAVPAFAEDLLDKVAAMSARGTRLLLIDDINDSGGTIDLIRRRLAEHGGEMANLRFAVLLDNVRSKVRPDYRARAIDRQSDKRWFVFPWEALATDDAIMNEARSVPERLA